ncbi:MAG: adventurous gliding motility protein CglE [Myxococcota bacterium]
MAGSRLLACAALSLLGSVAHVASAAEEQAGGDVPRKAQRIQAVERGFFLSLDFGGNLNLTKLDGRSYGFGVLTGVFAGYDITPFLSISLGATGMVATGSSDNPVQGDLMFISPMAQLQFAFVTTERDFVYAKGGVGVAFGLPDKVGTTDFGGVGVTFRALVGYEHYMKLRHFSLGVQAGVTGVTKPGVGIGISLMPTVKYTF